MVRRFQKSPNRISVLLADRPQLEAMGFPGCFNWDHLCIHPEITFHKFALWENGKVAEISPNRHDWRLLMYSPSIDNWSVVQYQTVCMASFLAEIDDSGRSSSLATNLYVFCFSPLTLCNWFSSTKGLWSAQGLHFGSSDWPSHNQNYFPWTYLNITNAPMHQCIITIRFRWKTTYPVVNVYITIENHLEWENSLFLWPFSIANC